MKPLHHKLRLLGRLNDGPKACSVFCMLVQSAHADRPQLPVKGVGLRQHTRQWPWLTASDSWSIQCRATEIQDAPNTAKCGIQRAQETEPRPSLAANEQRAAVSGAGRYEVQLGATCCLVWRKVRVCA
jgi:hypothetical protein